MKVNEKLIRLRKQLGLSQEELAKQLFITRQSVSLWEKGETVPSLDNLIMLKKLYGISIDEWVSEEGSDSAPSAVEPAVSAEPTRKNRKNKIVLTVCVLSALLTIIVIGTINLVSRYNELYVYGTRDDTYICREQIYLTDKSVPTVIFEEANKPRITGAIPSNYVKSDRLNGLYVSSDKNGDFIQITSEFEQSVPNVIAGFDGYKYLSETGFTSVMDMSKFALRYELDKVSIFSSRKDIATASAVRRIRAVLYDADANASENVYYHIVSGEMNGFALNVVPDVWFITLQDYKDNYCYMTIKAPEGVGKNADAVNEFLSTISVCYTDE